MTLESVIRRVASLLGAEWSGQGWSYGAGEAVLSVYEEWAGSDERRMAIHHLERLAIQGLVAYRGFGIYRAGLTFMRYKIEGERCCESKLSRSMANGT